MTGPHPVVGVAAKLPDRCGRRKGEAHVGEDVVDDEVVPITLVEGDHLHGGVLVPTVLLGDLLAGGADRTILLHRVRLLSRRLHDAGGDVDRLPEVLDLKPLDRELLRGAVGDEAIGDVVVLHGADALDGAEAAVVIGEDKPLVGCGDAGAAAAEDHHRIGDAGVGVGEELGRVDLQPKLFHPLDILLLQLIEDPHPLVRAGGGGEDEEREEAQQILCS